jgi:hypothetical protein
LKKELAEMLDELESLTRKMDVPPFKVRNVAWLNRNLAVRNKDAEEYPRAKELIKELLSNGVANG